MELVQAQDCFNLPIAMFEDERFKELSLSAIVLYAVLADRAIQIQQNLIIKEINEIQLRRFLSFTDEAYKNAVNQLKKAQILKELVQNKRVSFVLDTSKVEV
ncbi:replication initiator protein A [Aerococcaceae bacterium NML191219]|nr:replication initiator protein A [Aerococcaceae bacterium NML191219]